MYDRRFFTSVAEIRRPSAATSASGEQKLSFSVHIASLPCNISPIGASSAGAALAAQELGLDLSASAMMIFPHEYSVRPEKRGQNGDLAISEGRKYRIRRVWKNPYYSRALLEEVT